MTDYAALHKQQLEAQDAKNAHSANVILDILGLVVKPTRPIDVGCGIGTWLKVLRERGAKSCWGIEGVDLDLGQGIHTLRADLENENHLALIRGNHYKDHDLAISLEVAEHLPKELADSFIFFLTGLSDLVLFSAAIPWQGGHGHVNEQFIEYWAEKFDALGFVPIDMIRPMIWEDASVHWWLRQNCVLFAKREVAETDLIMRSYLARPGPLSIIHPNVYAWRAEKLFDPNWLPSLNGITRQVPERDYLENNGN